MRDGGLVELTEVPGRHTSAVPVPLPAPGFFLQGHTRTPGIVSRWYGYECRTTYGRYGYG